MISDKISSNSICSLVSIALKNGILKKKPCQICGNEIVEGHHINYTKPLLVIWLCKKHHARIHIHLRNAGWKASGRVTMSKLNIEIDDELKKKLNMKVAELGTTQKEWVSTIIKSELKQPKNKLKDKLIDLLALNELFVKKCLEITDVKCGDDYCDDCIIADLDCNRPKNFSK